ncbi:hypothetical protein JXB02_00035 [Candidatus Woesearchaeota archaeon]|nr:hypothetical protein [Candidatus Woesearchaeota archaeon]
MSGRRRQQDRARVPESVSRLLLLVLLLPAMAGMASGQQVNASLSAGASDTSPVWDRGSDSPLGGTSTQVDLVLLTQTQYWQGYYGSYNATISLKNAAGASLFTWGPARSGEVLAARSPYIDWEGLGCADAAQVLAENAITGNRSDAVNETFASPNVQAFSLAGIDYAQGQCQHATFLYNATQEAGTYEEVVMHDGTNAVYVSIVASEGEGFAGAAADFEMIVPEDGSDDVPTTYYFYAEIG